MSYYEQQIAKHVSKLVSWSVNTKNAIRISDLISWYSIAPSISTYRVNSLFHTVDEVMQLLKHELTQKYSDVDIVAPKIYVHNFIPECVVIEKMIEEVLDLTPKLEEVIIHASAGVPVLRGSDVFAPGVLGMGPNTKVGSEVSVFVDITKQCLYGYKQKFEGEKLFIGNGIAMKNRRHIFQDGLNKGVAVKMMYPVSGIITPECPKEYAILQNLPSMICVRVLDPKPDEEVLDMCAAPGNKTSHIALLMNDTGTLIAIDKPNRAHLITATCEALGIKRCVYAFSADSKKIVGEEKRSLISGPPFSRESFDRILLDVCCSGSGNRPFFKATITTEIQLRAVCAVQRSIFYNAVSLLKTGGILVYSTCSIYSEENEELVAWALHKFPDITLVKAEPYLGGPGWPNCGLSDDERHLVQRFGIGTPVEDSIGFFIAKFIKK